MAMIDYGAIVKKNGVFINKNDGLFMNTDNMDIPEMVTDHSQFGHGETDYFNHDYYVFIGDGTIDGRWIGFYKTWAACVIDHERVYLIRDDTGNIDVLGFEPITIEELCPRRFLLKTMFGEDKYEVIYGYGIDPSEEVWNRIKNTSYDFSDKERALIDSWFKGDD